MVLVLFFIYFSLLGLNLLGSAAKVISGCIIVSLTGANVIGVKADIFIVMGANSRTSIVKPLQPWAIVGDL